ncbi:MAG: GTPase HflX [Alphaproteobacteria bacterium]
MNRHGDGRGAKAEEASAVGRALVIHPAPKSLKANGRTPEASLEEAEALARAIALTVAHGEVVRLAERRPATLFGKGTVERLGGLVTALEIGVVVVDAGLTAVQQRNLERAWQCKVIDRTALILEIFGERARTREGRLQVELAHLSYQRSRLVRSWTHLERQRGGFGFLGGPGERQLEIDRRLIGERIIKIKRELEGVVKRRELHRAARRRVSYPVVAFVGYTNAGKSTLFNQLTRAAVFAENLLFATLDPTMRSLALPSGRAIILSDTVGFISHLPVELVAAFRATLEEVCEADAIVHVRDISHPESEAQKEDVHVVLREIGLGREVEEGLIEVLNKIDRLAPAERARLREVAARSNHPTIPLSALTGEGCAELLVALDGRLSEGRGIVAIDVPLADGATLAWLYRRGEVLSRTDDEAHAHVRVRLEPADQARLAHRGMRAGS